jgi:hypothetical protein
LALRNAVSPIRKRATGLAQDADVVGVDEVGHGPAGEVVFRHALVGERLPFRRLPGRIGAEDGKAAYLLVAAGVVDLVKLVARAELGADRG